MPKANLKLYPTGAAVLTSVIIFLIAWQGAPILGKSVFFLFCIFAVTINTGFGGFKYGVTVITAAALTSIFLFVGNHPLFSPQQVIALYEVLLFTITASLGGYLLEKYKKTDIVSEYKQRGKEYREKIEILEAEKKKLQQEVKMRDEFLSIASHELKTPLTSMLLKLQAMLHSIRNVSLAQFSVENLLKMLETAEQQTQRLSRMINDLLNISLITTGRLNLELGKSDLTDIAKEVAEEFAEKLAKGGYILKLEIKEPVVAWVDKLRIAQVISNLISNAIKYGDGKPIELRVIKHDTWAEIKVQDHGIGIHDMQKEKLFDLFERGLNGTRSSYKGLGVGLYISNQIIKAHNGRIKVKSRPDFGSTFTVELPLKQTK